MSDWTLPLRSALVVGKSGSGKSTFAYSYLWHAQDVACRFVFDDTGQCAARIGWPHSSTANEVEAALQTRRVNFNPHRMFRGRLKDAFRWFCRWAFEASQRGRGRKIVFVDEIWRFQDRNDIPVELASIAQAGRAEGIELVSATQHPHLVNASITGNLTELVCFKLDDSADLKKVQQLGANAEEVAALPLGTFIAINKNSGYKMRHQLFVPRSF